MIEGSPIAISGVGLCSSLTGAVQAAAAFRSGLAWPQTYGGFPSFDPQDAEPYDLIAHPAAGIAEGFQGLARLIRMSQEALADLKRQLSLDDFYSDRLGGYLVSTASEGLTPEHPLVDRMWTRALSGRKPKHRQLSLGGAAELHRVLRQTSLLLQTGRLDACLLGVADSLCQLEILRCLALKGRLKGIGQPVGLTPGEAVCFVLLERASTAQQAGRVPLALLRYAGVEHVGEASEEVPAPIQAGRALAAGIAQALAAASVADGTPGAFYSDLNGEVEPAKTLGYAVAGLPGGCPVRSWSHFMPATSFGDTGAAAPFVALCLALQAFARGYQPGPYALIVQTQGTEAIGSILIEQGPAALSRSGYQTTH